MRVVFMGSSELSCVCLHAIHADGRHDIVGVVTPPDRPSGRHLYVAPCMAGLQAREAGLTVLAPDNVNSPESIAALRMLSPDVIVVVAYGQMLKRDILELPPKGCVNMHYSLLPKYRGAAPIQWAIVNGERITGVTAMFMNARMDAGDIIRQSDLPIRDDDTAGDLQERLGDEGARVLVSVLRDLAEGGVTSTPQDESLATFAPKLRKSDGGIDWTASSCDIYNRIRAFNPWPSCFCLVPGSKRPRLRVLASRVEAGLPGGRVGEVIEVGGDGPVVATGTTGLRLLEVQPEGGRSMRGSDYVRGSSLGVGTHLGGG